MLLYLDEYIDSASTSQRPDIPSDSCNETVKEIIHKCWDSDPKVDTTLSKICICLVLIHYKTDYDATLSDIINENVQYSIL